MTKRKKAPGWRRGFLRALARTGNVRASAAIAGVHYGAAYYQRGRDDAFAARWARAVAKGKALVAAGEVPAAASAAGAAGAAELIPRKSKREGTQLVRAGPGRWNAAAEKRFFAKLIETGNVLQACAAAGFTTTALYQRRAAWPDFAAKWAAAVDAGHARLDMYLIEAANRAFEDPVPDIPDEAPRATIAEAIAIRRLRPAADRRAAPPEPGIEEVRARILARIEAIETHRKRGGA